MLQTPRSEERKGGSLVARVHFVRDPKRDARSINTVPETAEGLKRAIKAVKGWGNEVKGEARKFGSFKAKEDRKKKKGRKKIREVIPRLSPLAFAIVQQAKKGFRESSKPLFFTDGLATGIVRVKTATELMEEAHSDKSLLIIQIATEPATFVVAKDKKIYADDNGQTKLGKFKPSFPGGGRRPNETISDAAMRECLEETGIETEITEANRLGILDVSETHSIHVFFLTVPAGTLLRPGPNQEKVFLATADEIEEMIANKNFLPNHILAWYSYLEQASW